MKELEAYVNFSAVSSILQPSCFLLWQVK